VPADTSKRTPTYFIEVWTSTESYSKTRKVRIAAIGVVIVNETRCFIIVLVGSCSWSRKVVNPMEAGVL
jgi:hypothetical protein